MRLTLGSILFNFLNIYYSVFGLLVILNVILATLRPVAGKPNNTKGLFYDDTYLGQAETGDFQYFCRNNVANGPLPFLVSDSRNRPYCYFPTKVVMSIENGIKYCNKSYFGSMLLFENQEEWENLKLRGIIEKDEVYGLHPIVQGQPYPFQKSSEFIVQKAKAKGKLPTEKNPLLCISVQEDELKVIDCATEVTITCVNKESSWPTKEGFQLISECPQTKYKFGLIKTALAHNKMDNSYYCYFFFDYFVPPGHVYSVSKFCEINFAAASLLVESESEDGFIRSIMPWGYYHILLAQKGTRNVKRLPHETQNEYAFLRALHDSESHQYGDCIYMSSNQVRDSYTFQKCLDSTNRQTQLVCKSKISEALINQLNIRKEYPKSNNTYEVMSGNCKRYSDYSNSIEPVMVRVNKGEKHYCLYDFIFYEADGLDINDAEDFCSTVVHGHLLSIVDENELKFVHDLLFPPKITYQKFLLGQRLLGVEIKKGLKPTFYDGTNAEYVKFIANNSRYYQSPDGKCIVSVRSRHGDSLWPAKCTNKYLMHSCKVDVKASDFEKVFDATEPEVSPSEKWLLVVIALSIFGSTNLFVCFICLSKKVEEEDAEARAKAAILAKEFERKGKENKNAQTSHLNTTRRSKGPRSPKTPRTPRTPRTPKTSKPPKPVTELKVPLKSPKSPKYFDSLKSPGLPV